MYIQWNSDILTIYIWDKTLRMEIKLIYLLMIKLFYQNYTTRKKRKKIKQKLKKGENKIKIFLYQCW